MNEPTNNLPPHNGKSATLFSGGEGAGLGMVAAGFSHAWGIEYSDDIAQVARDNGFNVLTADILECNPADFESVDWLHASPPCPNFSNAKTNGKETENDRALAAKVCQFATELLPRVFTLENVYQYRKSQSWQTIAAALLAHGYQVNYWHVNMADYGVPQTRKRMIVIARRDGITPMLPPATHSETPVNGFFERRERWVSWYEAIEDLIPTLPDSRVEKTLASHWGEKNAGLVLYQNKDRGERGSGVLPKDSPAMTMTSSLGASRIKMTSHFKAGEKASSMTPHANARFQSFPRAYRLPEKSDLACRIIGNAVPPLFMQRIGESIK